MGDWFAASQEHAHTSGDDELPFVSRRSPVVCRNGCVASSQPLASSIGVDFIRKGANAADASIAVAAALAVLEPVRTFRWNGSFAGTALTTPSLPTVPIRHKLVPVQHRFRVSQPRTKKRLLSLSLSLRPPLC
jgi:hypothetical protein